MDIKRMSMVFDDTLAYLTRIALPGPGYAPDLNPDELVWSHVKRTGTARRPLQKGEKLREKMEAQLATLKEIPNLVRSFFKAPSVAYITDC